MALAYPNLSGELEEKYPDMYKQLCETWTRDTKCVHCSDTINRRTIWHVPLCKECSTTAAIRAQYQRMVQ